MRETWLNVTMEPRIMRMIVVRGTVISLLVCACGPTLSTGDSSARGVGPDPRVAAAELFSVDSAFSAQAGAKGVTDALADMFADDVVMGAGREHTFGKTASLAALRTNPENATTRMSWTPLRAGISSDGLHGFTQGYVTMVRAGGAKTDGKYLGYWVKGPLGWRLAVYKRAPRPLGDVSLVPAPNSLPQPGLRRGDIAQVARYLQEVRDAEAAFSADAGTMGMGPAFLKWGATDAMNLGAGPEWARGPAAISQVVAGFVQPGRRTSWGADTSIVAATGDLGVTIGHITQSWPDSAGKAPVRFPFFTVWKRARPGEPWRYVAE